MVSLKAFTVSLLLSLANARGFVELPVHEMQNVAHPVLSKRQHQLPMPNEYAGLFYIINITIGSDNQTVSVLFDTGSDELWVNPQCQTAEEPTRRQCGTLPRYNASSSTTARYLGKDFRYIYGTGPVYGQYITDDISFGSAVLRGQQFGVANTSVNSYTGILGARKSKPGSYCTFLDSLVEQGQVESIAFSVDLRAMNETGSVIFGGIDTKKFKCRLIKVPAAGVHLNLTGIGQSLPNKSSIAYPSSVWNKRNNSDGLSMMIDSGTQTNLVPLDLFFAVGNDYPGATLMGGENGTAPRWSIPCDTPAGSFDFTFGIATIRVPYSAMIQSKYGECSLAFTIGPFDDTFPDKPSIPPILGAPFLRGAYVVFDMDNNEIWIGEPDDCGSAVVPIGKGKDAVPDVAGCGCEDVTASHTPYAAPSATF